MWGINYRSPRFKQGCLSALIVSNILITALVLPGALQRESNTKETGRLPESRRYRERTPVAQRDTPLPFQGATARHTSFQDPSPQKHIQRQQSLAKETQGVGVAQGPPIPRSSGTPVGSEGRFQLPHVLVIGSKKSGTGTLKYFLGRHPSLAVREGEVHFFDDEALYPRGLQWYQDQLLRAHRTGDQLLVEGSPAYFHTPAVPERIQKMNESIKMLLILRDPVVRLVSDYVHMKLYRTSLIRLEMSPSRIREMEAAMGPKEFPDFEWLVFDKDGRVDTTLRLVTNGLYVEHLKRYLRYFKREQILVINGLRFKQYPWEELQRVESFLNVSNFLTKEKFNYTSDKGYYCFMDRAGCMRDDKGRPHPDLNPSTLHRLKAFYKPYNEELFKLINQRFDW